MSLLRGPHHCTAVATATAELIFKHLQARCLAAGAPLGAAELEQARAQFFASLPNAFTFMDQSNQRCMEASAATAPPVFAQEAILGSLLMACAQKAARTAFPMQIERFGGAWVRQFFNGLAGYIREHVCPTADDRLRKVYAAVSVSKGARLASTDLMEHTAVRQILRECLAPLLAPGAEDDLATPISDKVSLAIAVARGVNKPDISKVTEQEMRNFLIWLPPQVNVALGPAG
jgi:hypothetical protein